MKNKKYLFIGGVCIAAAILIALNWENENFFQANLLQILTLSITAIFSFFFVQLWTDKRRKVDCFERVLAEIQEKMCNDDVIFSRQKDALHIQKSMGNKISYLYEHTFKEAKEDLKYLQDEFTELRELYGEHRSSDESLAAVQTDIDRHRRNISDKCEKIRIALYDL